MDLNSQKEIKITVSKVYVLLSKTNDWENNLLV